MAKTALTKSGRASARNSQIRDQGRLDFPAWPPINVIGMDVFLRFRLSAGLVGLGGVSMPTLSLDGKLAAKRP